eukprot:2668982-Amphidinium_carterae.1
MSGRDRHGRDHDPALVADPVHPCACGSVPSFPIGSSQVVPTLLDTPARASDVSHDRDKRKEETLVLTLDACPKRPKKYCRMT